MKNRISRKEAMKTRNELGILIQTMVLVLLIIFAIISIGITELWLVTRTLVMILGLVMAYNNHVLYKRNSFTIMYLLISVCMYIYIIFNLLGIL